VRLVSATEIGLALIFLGRSLTRVYFRRAVDRFGMVDAVALAREPGTGVVPAWVSVVLLSGWVIAAVAACWLVLS
jgi:hypothetical protein